MNDPNSPPLGGVLYVDDDASNRVVFDLSLQDVVSVQSVASAAEALAVLEADASVLVLVADLRMPEVSGLMLCQAVRERHPAIRRVLVSAYGQEALIRGALTAGIVDLFVPKPLRMDEVSELLRAELRKSA